MSDTLNADDFLIVENDTEIDILRKNESGDFIKVGSYSRAKYEAAYDDRVKPSLRVEFHFDARQPFHLNIIQYLSAAELFALADKVRALSNENDSE